MPLHSPKLDDTFRVSPLDDHRLWKSRVLTLVRSKGALAVAWSLLYAESAAAQSKPTVSVTADATHGYAPLTVHFSALGNPPSAPNSSTATYDWDFGDKTFGKGRLVTHTYQSSGTYRVSVVYTRFINHIDPPEEQQHATNFVVITLTNRPAPAKLDLNPRVLEFQFTLGERTNTSRMVRVANQGGSPARWSIAPSSTWLKVDPSQGSLAPNQDVSISIIVSNSFVAVQTNRATLTVSSRDATNSPVTVQVTAVILKQSGPSWLFYCGALLVASAGAVALIRRLKASPRGSLTVRAIIDPGLQKVTTKKSIVLPGLRTSVIFHEATIGLRRGGGNLVGETKSRKADI